MGGALVFGALRPIMHRPRGWDVLLLGLGLAVLANSRPSEGLVVSLPVADASPGDVRYGPQYSTEHKWAYSDWVYNDADIDGHR